MASNIDPLIPADDEHPTKASFRANFSAAKTEIEALQAVAAGVISVKDATYGAAGDYDPVTQTGTNDQAAFDAAIAASANNSIFLPEGNYLITTHPGTDVEMLGPGRIYLDGTKDVNGKILHVGVSEGTNTHRIGGLAIGGEGPGPDGVIIKSGGNPAWTKVQPTRAGTEIKWQTYTSAYAGLATSVISTGFIDVTVGGLLGLAGNADFEVGDLMGYGGVEYRVKTIEPGAVTDRIELETPAGGAVSFAGSTVATYYHCYQYAEGTCDTSGTACTWKSGDYFNGLADTAEDAIKINGVDYDISDRTNHQNLVLASSAGVQTGVAFKLKTITDERRITSYNLQGLRGDHEENFNIYMDILGHTYLRPGIAGSGTLGFVRIRGGANSDDGGKNHVTFHPNGGIAIGRDDFSIAGATRAKMEIYRQYQTAASGGGTDELKQLRIGANFAGANSRQMDFGLYNDFSGGYINSAQDQRIYLQPGGGDVVIGVRDTSNHTGGLDVDGPVGPHTDNSYDFGSSSFQWVAGWFKGPVKMGEYTVAGVPSAATYQGAAIMVTDETGGYTMAFSDGTNWRRVQDRAIIS